MKHINLLLTLLFISSVASAQSYAQEIEKFRNNYVAEHLQESHSPIKYQQVKDLHFFAPSKKLKVEARVTLIADKEGFDMHTFSGDKRTYYKYAKLSFSIKGKKQTLYLYRSKGLMNNPEYQDYLFLPFTDGTNYKTTFGGGRYIDFKLGDIKNNKLIIDFNKCYNPYCAYSSGYSCPIPPNENRLDIAIKAGEKLFLGKQNENQH